MCITLHYLHSYKSLFAFIKVSFLIKEQLKGFEAYFHSFHLPLEIPFYFKFWSIFGLGKQGKYMGRRSRGPYK